MVPQEIIEQIFSFITEDIDATNYWQALVGFHEEGDKRFMVLCRKASDAYTGPRFNTPKPRFAQIWSNYFTKTSNNSIIEEEGIPLDQLIDKCRVFGEMLQEKAFYVQHEFEVAFHGLTSTNTPLVRTFNPTYEDFVQERQKEYDQLPVLDKMVLRDELLEYLKHMRLLNKAMSIDHVPL